MEKDEIRIEVLKMSVRPDVESWLSTAEKLYEFVMDPKSPAIDKRQYTKSNK